MFTLLLFCSVFITIICADTKVFEIHPPHIKPFPRRNIQHLLDPANIKDVRSHHYNTFAVNSMEGYGPGIYGNGGINYAGGMNALAFYDPKSGNVTTAAPPPNGAELAENDQAVIDQKNNLYYYFTEVYNQTEQLLHSFFAPYNLSDPTNGLDIIELPKCYADFLVGAGTAFAANPNTGDIYMWCHDAVNYLEVTDLLKLTWNDKTKTIDSTVIQTYNVGDILTFSTYPTILDTKRNAMWVIESYGHNITNFTIQFNYVDLSDGSIPNQINMYNWTLITGIYSELKDTIVSLVPYIIDKGIDKYLGVNVTYNDPITTEMTQFVANVDFGNDTFYCNFAPVYTMDDKNGIWYQLMYRNPDYSSCITNNGTLFGDLISVDIATGQLVDVVHICEYGVNQLTCPLSMEYYYPKS